MRTSAPERQRRGPLPHIVLWLMAGLVTAAAFWAYVGRLDVVATAMGEVVPSTQVKSVEHLEGGIVREILVREGERVSQGQALIELDPVRSDADVKSLQSQRTDLLIDVQRLSAESDETETVSFSEDLKQNHPELVQRAKELFESRRSTLENRLFSQAQRIEQRKNEMAAINRRIANNFKRLKLVKEQIKISEGLMEDQLSNRMNHLNLLKEAAALESRISEDRSALPRAEAALKEHEAAQRVIRSENLQEVREQLRERQISLAETESNLLKYKDELSRTTLRSPVDGVIKTLYVATVGGVVRSGATVVDVVPASDRLIIEARLPTQDIGYVRPGQKVNVTLASSDAIRFGRIEGEVTSVSPDSIDNEEGIPYYRVRVETSLNYFERGTVKYELYPGVQVAAAIRTGERSVMAYLLDPFLTSVQTAMRER